MLESSRVAAVAVIVVGVVAWSCAGRTSSRGQPRGGSGSDCNSSPIEYVWVGWKKPGRKKANRKGVVELGIAVRAGRADGRNNGCDGCRYGIYEDDISRSQSAPYGRSPIRRRRFRSPDGDVYIYPPAQTSLFKERFLEGETIPTRATSSPASGESIPLLSCPELSVVAAAHRVRA